MTAPRPDVRVLDDPEAVAAAALDELLAVLPRAADGPPVAVALAGGRTPLRAYELLAGRAAWIAWNRVHLFWGDERCVRPDHPDSNYGAADAKLVAHVPIALQNVHRIRGEAPPAEAAAEYERDLGAFFAARHETAPAFDLVLLGMGGDGHTASLFPGGPEGDERVRWAVPSRAPAPPHDRVTLTIPALAAARRVLFLVTGAEKAAPLARVLAGDPSLPAARVAAASRAAFVVDRAAAGG